MDSKYSLFVLTAAICYLPLASSQSSGGGGGGGGNLPSNYANMKIAHAVLAIVAWVVFFPLGAVLLRLLRTPHAPRVHYLIQIPTYTIFIAAAGMGIWMARTTQQLGAYHPVTGLVLLAAVFIQAVGGAVQHLLAKKGSNVHILALSHIWLGRVLVTLGMINGGLGLLLSGDGSRGDYIAYGVIAGITWVIYLSVVICVQAVKRDDEQVEKGSQRSDESRS